MHLCNKEKMSKDGKTRTMEELAEIQSEDFTKATASVNMPLTSSASGSQAVKEAKEIAFDLEQANNPMFLAAQLLDLKIGNNFTIKDQPANRIWTLVALEPKKVTLEHIPLLEPTKKMTMSFDAPEIALHLKATKLKMPKIFPHDQLHMLWPSNSSACMEETEKCGLFVALQDAYNMLDMDENEIMVQSHPIPCVLP